MSCIEWDGRLSDKGYGVTWHNGRDIKAHRLAWIRAHGPIPDGLEVRHVCDNRACVNPEHLLLGTHADNMRDMVERDRIPHGEQHRDAKLTESEVVEIRTAYGAGGVTTRDLAGAYGVSHSSIWLIVTRRTWRRV